jgi:glycosyltransferase involved in cell wall biosynthesis
VTASRLRHPSAARRSDRGPTIRILFCVLDYDPEPAGGAERQARLQADELARRGHRVTVVCRGVGGARSGPVGAVHVDRLRTGRTLPWRLSHYPRLAWYLVRRAGRHDLIHVHHANLQADVAVAIGRARRRPVYRKLAGSGPGGDIARWRWLRRWTGHAGLRRASVIQAQSPRIVEELRAVGVSDRRIVAIPNGVVPSSVERADPTERAEARRRLGLPGDAVVVLWLGRFAAEKGIEDLLRAWAPLRGDPGLALLLVGRPAGLRPVVPQPGGNVHVRPWQADPADALRAADLFVLPSHSEGMSNALLEAMAAGLPSIVTPVGGASLVAAARAGSIVPIGDVEALRAAILALAADPLERAAAGARARTAITDLTIDRVVDRIETVYRRLVEGR